MEFRREKEKSLNGAVEKNGKHKITTDRGDLTIWTIGGLINVDEIPMNMTVEWNFRQYISYRIFFFQYNPIFSR